MLFIVYSILIAAYGFVVTIFGSWVTNIVNLGRSSHGGTALLFCSNSTVILHDHKPSTTLQSLTVTEDTGYPGDFDHKIFIYWVDLQCSEIQVQEETYNLTGTDFSLINETTTYALAGSSMTYNICGSSNSSYQSERLELTLLNSLEALRSPSRDYHKFYHFTHGTDGNWICNQVTYNMGKNGYYTPLFLTVPQEATYTYSVTYQRKFLNESISSSFSYMLKNDKDTVTLNLLSSGQHCFVATILENPTSTNPYVHINLAYKYYSTSNGVVIWGFSTLLFCILSIILLISLKFCGNYF